MTDIPFPELKLLFEEDPAALVNRVPGVFLVNKPEGPTSHDIVYTARRRLGLKKVGHGGTLDPMADGLLLILAGRATRLFDAMLAFTKSYTATLRFGERTDTHDRTGAPIDGADASRLPITRETFEQALEKFRGDILQIPPMHSALKKNGRKLYELAREGKTVEREPRPMTVTHLEIISFDGTTATITMTVSKGFYVRTLIDDLGQALGCGAVMSALTRTAIGPFRLEDATPPDAITAGSC